MMDKILVLGGTGFVGKELSKRLPHASYLVRKSSNVEHLRESQLVFGDILNLDQLLEASKDFNIIINLTGPSKQMGNINTEVIIKGTKNILQAAKHNNIKRLINLSSMAANRQAIGPYGQAKKDADQLLEKSTTSTINLKPTLIYGKGGAIFEKLIKTIDALPKVVPVFGDGEYRIQPIYVKDLTEAILSTLKLPLKTGQHKTYELGGENPISYKNFVQKVLQAQGKQKRLINIPLKFIYFLAKLFPGLNKTMIDRAIETINIDVEKSSRDLNLRLTSYDKALREILNT
jgi:nucleoside-diphosphate-sugar epimerase